MFDEMIATSEEFYQSVRVARAATSGQQAGGVSAGLTAAAGRAGCGGRPTAQAAVPRGEHCVRRAEQRGRQKVRPRGLVPGLR